MTGAGGQHSTAAGTPPERADAWFESAPGCGCLYLSPSGLILKSNAELLGWLGYEKTEVEGQMRLVDLLNFGGRIFYETHIALLLKANRKVNGIALDLLSKNGVTIPVLMNATQEQDSAGAPQYSRAVFFDTRERRSYEHELLAARKQAERDAEVLAERNLQLERAERALTHRAEQLARANEDLLHFAYAVSHDLKTPLRTVISFSQLLAMKAKGSLDGKSQHFLDSVVKAASRMGTMLEDLLHLAKTAGEQIQICEAISLNEVVERTLQILAAAIQDTQAKITIDSLPVVPGDVGQFSSLFQNLVGNAIKYRRQEVPLQIHISAEQKDGEWMISVRDNGLGFEPEVADRIFGVFQRLHGTEIEGTGIGLTICKRIVQRFGGRIWALGRPGEGAEFSFTIPREVAASNFDVEADQTSALVERITPAREEPSTDPVASGRHFDELFELLNLTHAMVRKMDGTILVWTDRTEQMFGWTKAEALGRQAHELFRTEFPIPLAEIKSTLLRKGDWSGTLKRYKRDGTAVWLASHWSLYRDGSGRPQSVIEIYSDITDLRRTELELQASSRQRDIALSAGQMGVWRWDSRTGVVEWDTTIESFLGMDAGSFERTFEGFTNRVHPDDLAGLQAQIRKALENRAEYSVEFRMRHVSGKYCWQRGRGRTTLDDQGLAVGLTGVVWDVTASRQTQDELRAAQARLALGVQLSDLALADIDYEAGTTHLSSDAAHCFGLGEAAITVPREVVHATFHPEDREELLRRIEACLDPAGPGWFEMDHRVIWPDGSVHWLSVRKLVLFAGTGASRRPLNAILAVIDVTARKLTELAWLEAAERLRIATEAAHLGVFDWDIPRDVVHWENSRTYEIMGRSREDGPIAGEEFFREVIHPDDVAPFQKAIADATAHDGAFRQRCRVRRKDGVLRWLEFSGQFEVSPTGAPLRLVGVIADVTEQIESEQALRNSERRLRELLDALPAAVYTTDAEGRLTMFNQAAVEFAGRVPTLAQDTWCVSWKLHWSDGRPMPHDQSPHALTLREGRPIRGVEAVAERPDGTRRHFIPYPSPLYDDSGQLNGAVNVLVDITDRKRMEEVLRQSEERYSLAAKATSDGLFDVSIKTGEAFLSPQWKETLGFPEGEPSDKHAWFLSRVHPEDVETVTQSAGLHFKEGRPYDIEIRVRRKDESYIWVRSRAEAVRDESGTAIRMVGTMTDITPGKLDEQYLRIAFDLAPVGMAYVGLDECFVKVNERMCEISGHSAEELTGMKVSGLTHPDDIAADEAKLLPYLQGKTPQYRNEKRYVRKDGSIRWVAVTARMIRDAEGKPLYSISVIQDVHDAKVAAEALRQGEERYRLVEQATDDALWDWNPITGENYLSPRWKALLGFEEQELPNREESFFSRLHPEDTAGVTEALRQHFDEHHPYQVEVRLRPNTGSYRWFRSRGAAIRDHSGKVIRMVGSISDITQRKQAEHALLQRTAELEALLIHAPIGFATFDREYRYLRINNVLCDINGLPVEAHLGRTVAEVLPNVPGVAGLLEQVFTTGKSVQIEVTGETAKQPGVTRYWLAGYYPVLGEEQDVAAAGVFVIETTERKRAEDQLRTSEAEFRATFEQAAVGKAQISAKTGRFIRVNAEYCRITGYSAGELAGMKPLDLTFAEDRAVEDTWMKARSVSS